MRWQGQDVNAVDEAALPGMSRIAGFVRSVRTPEFAGVTFHEVLAKSALNRVPGTSSMPFRWTINPSRGCLHQCRYCFARQTHSYLDFDTGRDFDTQIVIKTNIVEVLRRELAKDTWKREHVALGTNSDPYMRAEGRYRLMPGIITALAESGTPFSILTKGTLLRRDLPLLKEAARAVPVSLGISLAFVDPALQQSVEPGTPTPKARLDLIRAISDAGLRCDVLAAPILPWLTDSPEHLEALVSGISEAGAGGITTLALHLRPGVRDWFMSWLASEHPGLVERYENLYGAGAYVPKSYKTWLRSRTAALLERHRLTRGPGLRFGGPWSEPQPGEVPEAAASSSVGPDATLL